MHLIWTLVMVYGTAQNGYTLTNGPKCGLSTMKYILIKVGMYFIHRKLHKYTLHCNNTIFQWFWGHRMDELNRGCVPSMYSTRSIAPVRETAERSSGCVASFLLLSLLAMCKPSHEAALLAPSRTTRNATNAFAIDYDAHQCLLATMMPNPIPVMTHPSIPALKSGPICVNPSFQIHQRY